MKTTVLLLGATVTALGALTACGSSSPATSSSGTTSPPTAGGMVSVHDVSGVGQALVDPSGNTLYFAQQETGGMIKCTGDCVSVWVPATGTSAETKAVSGLGLMKRSDTGQEQLTYQGKPLYTFKLDNGPSQSKGNNAKDSFGGMSFTWHAATTTAAAAPSSGPSSNPSSAPSSTGGGNGY